MPRRPRGPHSPSAMPLRERSKRLVVQLQQEARQLRLNPPPFASGARSRSSPSSPTGATDDFAVTPRRRSGQDRRAPVVLTRELIESYFSMPLSAASKDLGLCATAIKKVCRKMGIAKWPFRDRLLAQKHEEEEAEEAARRNAGAYLRSGDDELDETAQERVVADMLVEVGGDDEGATSSADTRVNSDDTSPAQGPLSEVSDGSVVDATSCDHSVCDGSSPDDDFDTTVSSMAPGNTAPALASAAAPTSFVPQRLHQVQAANYPVKPVAPAPPARFGLNGGDCVDVQVPTSAFVPAHVETCAYPQDSLLGEFAVGDAGVFDGSVVDMDACLCLD
mmetsp:Transcript_6191/g.14965  ORF Transcript_6191/g.14965 Transcript_6191/m.14965 type:complete len:334 (-) Transcript_6191:355-1356(-)